MKHIFILNPNIGNTDVILKTLYQSLSNTNFDYETFVFGDEEATIRFIREYCEKHSEPVRFYACGGDGTLHVVVNSIAAYPQASVSAYSIGQSNDFVKYYGGKKRFSDPAKLCAAPESVIDLIKIGSDVAVNACHFGLDSCVADTKNRIRKKPLIGKKLAYPISVLHAFFFGMRHHATILVDGKSVHEGDFLLCTIANGSFVGGSYCCAPRSKNNDGWLDFCLVKHTSRLRFLMLMHVYQRGLHLDDPKFRKYLIYRRCRKVEVRAEKGFTISLDGEIRKLSNFTVEIAPSAIRFAVPERQND